MKNQSFDPNRYYSIQELVENDFWQKNYAFNRIREIGILAYLDEVYCVPLLPWKTYRSYEERQSSIERFKQKGPGLDYEST